MSYCQIEQLVFEFGYQTIEGVKTINNTSYKRMCTHTSILNKSVFSMISEIRLDIIIIFI